MSSLHILTHVLKFSTFWCWVDALNAVLFVKPSTENGGQYNRITYQTLNSTSDMMYLLHVAECEGKPSERNFTNSKEQNSQPVKKSPTSYGTLSFFTALTSARHLSLSWGTSVKSTPHLTPWRSILISASHLCLGLPSGLFPSGLPTTNLHAPRLPLVRATWPDHLILLGLITRIVFSEKYRSLSTSFCSLVHYFDRITLGTVVPKFGGNR